MECSWLPDPTPRPHYFLRSELEGCALVGTWHNTAKSGWHKFQAVVDRTGNVIEFTEIEDPNFEQWRYVSLTRVPEAP